MKHVVKQTHPSSWVLTPNSEGDKYTLHSNTLEDNLEIAACAECNGKGVSKRWHTDQKGMYGLPGH